MIEKVSTNREQIDDTKKEKKKILSSFVKNGVILQAF